VHDVVTLLTLYPFVLYLATAVLGLAVGSFLNVVILRLPPRMEAEWAEQCRELLGMPPDETPQPPGIALSRSRCPHCKSVLRAIDNIPVISFLLLRGRCAHCGGSISWRYPLVETLTALASLVVVWQFGVTAQAAAALLLTFGLIALTFIDIDHQLLPDNITLPGIWVGLLLNAFGLFTDLHSAVLGAVFGYLLLWSVFHVFRLVTGKEGMGFGDFKLLALLGAWMGWQHLPLIILLSALVGTILGLVLLRARGQGRDVPLSFGPYLAAAGWIALLWGDEITSAYLRFAGL
jgi:leader peptidase (prepilin peptidase) / N-methyltransferase